MGIIGANNPDACHTCDGGSNPPGTEFQQNNIAVTISAGYFIKPALGEFSMIDKVVQKLNSQTFTITEIQTPVCVVAFEQQGLVVKRKYKYIFKPGKGKYGLGGTPITTADLEYWVSETFTDIDASEDPNTIVVDLGDLPSGDYLNAANGAERDFNDTEKRYFVSYTKDGVGYLVMFVGDYGYYGGTYPDDFTAEDFVPTYDTTMPPNIVYTSQLINDGANGTDPFATVSALAAVEENAVKKNGSTLQTILGDIIIKGKLFIQGLGSILDGTTINAFFKKITSAENIEINTAIPTLPNHAIRKDFAEGLVNGMTLSVNQASAEMYLKNSSGTTLATLNLGFLNNEGTTFFYNEATQKLELKNDAGEILSEVPVSAFVSNLMQSVNFNGASPSVLEFKDASGTLVDSVTITVNNVAELQDVLDNKANANEVVFRVGYVDIYDTKKFWDSPIVPTLSNGDASVYAANTKFVQTAADARVANTISAGITASAPNQNAVFNALAGKANKEGTNATGTWPVSVTGNSGSATNWGGSSADFSTDGSGLSKAVGLDASNNAKRYTASSFKLWLAIAMTDVSGLVTAFAEIATSLAGKANLAGGNAFTGNQTIYATLSISDAPQGNTLKMSRSGFGALFGNSSTEDGLILYNLPGTVIYQRWWGDGNVTIGGDGTTNTGQKFQCYGNAKFTGEVTIPSGTASSSAVNKSQLDLKANKDGSDASGTWGINVTGSSGNSLLWNSLPINLSNVSPIMDYLLGVSSNSGVLLTAPVVKSWLSVAIVDVSGLTTSLALKADLVGGTVPASQLPSYVDDVLEYANLAVFPVTGESGKIYVAIDTNITYRWTGTAYVEISASLALGETSGSAYRGDRGKTAYNHSQIITGNPHNTSISDIPGLAAHTTEKEVFDYSATSGYNKSYLNATYGDRPAGFRLVCPSVGPGVVYLKPFAANNLNWRYWQMQELT